MLEYEVQMKEDPYNVNYLGIEVLYEIKDVNGVLIRKAVHNFAFNKSNAFTVSNYDKDNKPIPKWKLTVEKVLRDIEKNALKPINLKDVSKELLPASGKVRLAIDSETLDDDFKLLEELKYIGPEMARALLSRFNDLGGVLNANRLELIDISGIGDSNVSKIIKQLNELR